MVKGQATSKMTLRQVARAVMRLAKMLTLCLISISPPAFASGREVDVPDIQFQPIKPTRAVTIEEAVDIALRNYPAINNKYFKLRAAKANVTLAKTQYLPNINFDVQESGITANRANSTVMNNVSGF